LTDTIDENIAEELDDSAVESWSSRAQQRRAQRKRTGPSGLWDSFMEWPAWGRRTASVAMALFAVVLVVVLVDTVASAGKIHPGVVAAGVKIGGMDTQEAQRKLADTLPARMSEPVTVSFETTSWSIDAETIKASPDTTATAADAFKIGRTGGFWGVVSTRASAWFTPVTVDVPVTSDASATAKAIGDIVAQIDSDPVDATVVIKGTSASIAPAVLGRKADEASLRADVLAALVDTHREVTVSAELVPVRVTDEGAKNALAQAQRMLSGPADVTYEAKKWTFTAAEIAPWIDFRILGSDSTTGSSAPETSSAEQGTGEATEQLEAFVSAVEASKTVTARVGEAGKPAVDAGFKASGGTVNIVPHQDGVGPDIASLATELTIALKGDGPRSVALRTMRVQPDVTTDDAKAMGIKERISTYTTTYDAGNKPRVNNIHTLADAIDGTLIPPGGTFSFNGSVGPRTAAKGYQEAPAIVNGKLVPQLGGGICQVGTTVFNAVFESGFPVVERKNHSFYISHYPKGRDATVSWGGPDFKFKNDSATWVLLATGYSNSSLTISLYGTDPGYEVSSNTGAWTDPKPHPVEETKDPSLAAGKRIVEDSGVDGRTIIVTRTVKKNGTVVREDKFKSVYKTKTEVVRVGTAPVPGTVPTTTP